MNHSTNARTAQSIGFAFLLLAAIAHAGPRTSANYTVATDIVDAGGARTTSANYTNDGSVGGIVGISTVASPAETAKHGYIGQLTEVTALQLAAAPTTVNETATRQLSAIQLLDDLTTVAVPATSIAWSVQSGPLTGISTGGLATAATVYQNSTATAQGDYAGDTGALDLTVLDNIADNFGTYASDGLADDWQVQYFGEDNPMAAPDLDPDGDGDTNYFEQQAQLDPTDEADFLDITLVPGPDAEGVAAGEAKLTLSPGKAGTLYAIEFKISLLDESWTTLTTIDGVDDTLNYTDTEASGPRKFYQVRPARAP